MIRRREFIAALGGAANGPLAVSAQQQTKLTIGVPGTWLKAPTARRLRDHAADALGAVHYLH
jgi:hypothetical protein